MADTPFELLKTPDEKLDVTVSFTNDDDDVTYAVDSVDVVVTDKDGEDVTSTLFDSGSTTLSTNTATVWFENGDDGEIYYANVLATMETGQVINKAGRIIVKA